MGGSHQTKYTWVHRNMIIQPLIREYKFDNFMINVLKTSYTHCRTFEYTLEFISRTIFNVFNNLTS